MDLISTRDVAIHYGKTIREVRYAIQCGMITPTKIGTALLFEKYKLPKWTIRPKAKSKNIKEENNES